MNILFQIVFVSNFKCLKIRKANFFGDFEKILSKFAGVIYCMDLSYFLILKKALVGC
jgi:hypothetical protein